ncbi:hypothetical protein [Veillonella sp.]|jgi:predicted HicB family RNase H-like nuclease|uniref:hypothetical protein n=1 Tax=Veillonella sp. TaxID=1926307 RepID=UPI0020615FAD|nr:hypothetical protein [Veillonella sp.]DAT46085.1 MAG TPA: Transcriptional regulator, RHH-like, CopG [Caudoviricetes sp.]
MENKKDIPNPADFFFDSTPEEKPVNNNDDETATTNINIRELITVNKEKLSKRVQLTIYPTAYEQAKEKALKEGRSFNNYINELILKDLSK